MKHEAMKSLAEQLGTTGHISPLLMKARRLGLAEPEDLERLAILRGCRYYDSHIAEQAEQRVDWRSVSENDFTNTELALALLSVSLPKSQIRLRMGAAMIAADGVQAREVVRRARMERCESVVRHIAQCASQVEPDNPFWKSLLHGLPETAPKPWVLPDITRFVAMTGVTRRGTETVMQWIRPRQRIAA